MSKLITRIAKKGSPVQSEIWLQRLQRQVMHLLLRHNQQLFRGQFRAFFAQSALSNIPLLQLYDRYIKLQVLGDELLSVILPDIEIQLELRNDFAFLLEDIPTRGDIDWQRTIVRAINEAPDQPPQRFDTRMLQQSTSSPENLLVVAILHHFQQAIQEVLQADIQQEIFDDQERLALLEMEERAGQGLAKPYAHALREEASSVDIDTLAEQVASLLKPGTSPYRDLVTWWESFRDLHIGKTLAQRHLTLTNKRTDEQFENWLYELWIALEILDLLNTSHAIVPETLQIEGNRFQCLFTWDARRFRFRYQYYDARASEALSSWQGTGIPLSPYTIEREQPLKIIASDTVIWQEPPVMFAADYSGISEKTALRQAALQQLLGGMQLTEAYHGYLLSPMLPEPSDEKLWSDTVQLDSKKYSKRSATPISIRLYKLVPDAARDTLHLRLRAILQDAVDALPERPAPACYGILLDRDTVNASRQVSHRGNVLCPKPHIGPGVFDLVDDRLHCLKDPRLCHAYGQAIIPPFAIRVDTLNGLEQRTDDLRVHTEKSLREAERSDDEARVEQLRSHIFLGVGRTVEQYVQLHGDTASIEEHFEEWIFGEYWKKHPRHLSEETRNNLLSGDYVWKEYKRTKGLNDWAAPAVQYCRALENEIRRRIHDYYPDRNVFYADVRQKGFTDHMTLGFLETIYKYKGKSLHGGLPPNEQKRIRSAIHNWPLCEAVIRRAKCNISDFEQIVQRIGAEGVTRRRNNLAHGEAVPQSDAQALREAIIGQKGKPGILIWLAENLEPKK